MSLKMKTTVLSGLLLSVMTLQSAQAAIALDRTRVIYDSTQKSVSLNVTNENKKLPYLAQGWIEDAEGKKITSPLTVLPPVQRIEPGAKSQVKVQGLPAVSTLPQDRESLFYFNLREIPPKSDQPNTLQIALQTRIKLFYRPAALQRDAQAAPWQEQLTLTREGDKYRISNPTPYYITIVEGGASLKGKPIKEFGPMMLAPKSQDVIAASASAIGNAPVLTYINDYGGRPQLQFTCSGNSCKAAPVKQ